MPRNIPVSGDMTAVGKLRNPPFARTPDPATLFARRAARLRALATPGGIGPYLSFLADLAEAQARLARALPAPAPMEAGRLRAALDHAMPPVDRAGFRGDAAFDALAERLFTAFQATDMPDPAARALASLRGRDARHRAAQLGDLLQDGATDNPAEDGFLAAALQLHFARLAAMLPEERLRPIADGVCPSCGGPSVASVIVTWDGADGARYCACAQCATLWHHVRVKCTRCGSTKGIRYQEVDSGCEGGRETAAIKAETCDECGSYVKIMDQRRDGGLDPFADDVASLSLDILMRGTAFHRGAPNPFLSGY